MLAPGIEYSTETRLVFLYPGLKGTRYRHVSITEDNESAEKHVEKSMLALLFSIFLVQYDIAVEYVDADGMGRICDIEDCFAFN
jgi:hypothetical protein